MSKRSRRTEESISLKGKAKSLNSLIMLVLFPVRHPLVFFGILAVFWFVPTLIGAKPGQVHQWYAQKLPSFSFSKVMQPISDAISPKLGGFSTPSTGLEQIEETPYNRATNRRQMFQKSKEAINTVVVEEDIEIKTSPEPEVEQVIVEKEPMIIAPPQPRPLPQVNLELNYLKVSEVVSGKVVVLNANKLLINGKDVFLYGIYADPKSDSGFAGEDFLESFLVNQDVECKINAYTYQKVATAYCYVGTVSLNHLMVEKGFSKNVALGK